MAEGKSPDASPWLRDKAKVEKVVGDKDVFADGTVVMLATPGHTMGHHALLVRLAKSGTFILSGDLWAWSETFSEELSRNEISWSNMSRADTLASMDRILKVSANLKAKIIIQLFSFRHPPLP